MGSEVTTLLQHVVKKLLGLCTAVRSVEQSDTWWTVIKMSDRSDDDLAGGEIFDHVPPTRRDREPKQGHLQLERQPRGYRQAFYLQQAAANGVAGERECI